MLRNGTTKEEEGMFTNNPEKNTGHQIEMRKGPLKMIKDMEGKEIINGRTGIVTVNVANTDHNIQGIITAAIATITIIRDMGGFTRGLIITRLSLIMITVIITIMEIISITIAEG